MDITNVEGSYSGIGEGLLEITEQSNSGFLSDHIVPTATSGTENVFTSYVQLAFTDIGGLARLNLSFEVRTQVWAEGEHYSPTSRCWSSIQSCSFILEAQWIYSGGFRSCWKFYEKIWIRHESYRFRWVTYSVRKRVRTFLSQCPPW